MLRFIDEEEAQAPEPALAPAAPAAPSRPAASRPSQPAPAANPLAIQQPAQPAPFDTDKLEQNMGETAGPWSGKPGQLSNRGSLRNGLDAISRAGASPMGFLTGNKNDHELIKKFYSANPDVANQYGLPVNLTLRYFSGVGDKGLRISQQQGSQMLKAIQAAKAGDLSARMAEVRSIYTPEYAKSYEQRIRKGDIPVDTVDSFRHDKGKELGYSLGRFWATPMPNGSYRITEDFNFMHAPSAQGGNDARARAHAGGSMGPLSWLSIDPRSHAERLITQGKGSPFQYTLIVMPDGSVKSAPRKLSALQIRR